MDDREQRIVFNEALFREVNERVRELEASPGEPMDTILCVCECGDETCTQRIELTLGEYDLLRRNAARFAVVPGHEASPDVEVVVERSERFTVVEKTAAAARLARRLDPRG